MKTNKQSVNIIQFFAIKIFSAAILLLCIWAALQSGLTLQAKAAITFPADNLTVEAGETVYPVFDLSDGIMLYGYTITDAYSNVVVSKEYDSRPYSSPGLGDPFTITRTGTYTIRWTVGGYSMVVLGGSGYHCKPNYSNVGTLSQSFRVTTPASSYSGYCGPNLMWTLNRSSGVLTISGMGAMTDCVTSGPWSDYFKEIRTVIIKKGVTSIGDSAFYGHSYITSVTIPDSVTSIGASAFGQCLGLRSVNITDLAAWCGISFEASNSHPLYYGAELYLNGALLTEAIIPDGVTAIPDYAFYNCSSLTSITIPDSVTSIDVCAFSGCDSLASITIPDSVTSIGDSAFSACNSLRSVMITDLAAWCRISFGPRTHPLYNCGADLYLNGTLLTKAVIPSSVTTIPDYAFYGCDSLTSVAIPDSVTSIGDDAFCNCSGLTSVTIPDSVTSIGVSAFSACDSLTSITIGNGVTTIPDYAFYGCDSLTSVAIPDNVTSIGDDAFSGCNNLTFKAYGNAEYLGNSSTPCVVLMRAESSEITTCTIHPNTKIIHKGAFSSCKNLTNITIPDSVTSIGVGAFMNCTNLMSITVSDRNTTYSSQDGALFNKNKTTLIQCPGGKSGAFAIPDSVTDIPDRAFNNCSRLTSITIPDSVTSLPEGLLSGCGKLESLTIPFVGASSEAKKTSKSLFGYIFGSLSYAGSTEVRQAYKCYDSMGYWYSQYITYIPSALRSVTITGGNIFERAFMNCNSLTSVAIGNGVTSIGYCAFLDCTSLTSVAIGNGVTSLGGSAFSGCTSLTSITIPDSVTSIDVCAFDGCNRLARVVYCGTSSQWKEISIEIKNEPLKNATRTYHSVHEWRLHTATTPATCTEAGFGEYTCTVCGQIKNDTIPALGHKYTSKITTSATCTAAGLRTYTCSNNISHTYTETISSLGHNLVHHNAQAATCTQDGWREYEACTRCDYTTKVEISALGHSFTNYKSDGNATCVKDGTKTATCDRCSAKDTVTDVGSKNSAEHKPGVNTNCTQATTCTLCSKVLVAAGSHTWDSGSTTTAASCGSAGSRKYTCTVCGSTRTETISALGHSFTNYKSDGNATCVKDGTKTATCDRCSAKDTVTDVGSKNYAEHKPGEDTDCTKQSKCTLCGKVLREAGSHSWNSGRITTSATCTAAGVKTYSCTACGATRTETISATGHSWNNGEITTAATCTRQGVKTYTCMACGATKTETISATGHSWNNGEITTAATCATQGVKTYTCTKCGETKMEAVSALGHSWSKEKVVLQKPTVSATGMKAYVCTRCREQQGNESIPMLVPTIRVANGRGCPGRTAEVKLVISDNPGIAGAILKLDYAAGLTLQTIKVGDAVPGLEFTPPGNLGGNSVNLVWDGLDADESNGTMLTLTFAIGAEVPEGDYPVTISCEPGGIYDGKTEDVAFTLKQGKISVRNTLIADLNDDYAINVKDVTLLRRYIAGGYGFTPKDEAVADVNGDGVCNTRDITFLRRCLAGGFGVELS